MSLIKRSEWPLQSSGSWLSDLLDNEKFFGSEWSKKQLFPAVNVKETEKSYEVEIAAPGRSKNDFAISAENGILTIASESKEENEQKENGYTRREFSYSSFSRSFTLPEDANEDGINAIYNDGILKLEVAKVPAAEPKLKKAIEVK